MADNYLERRMDDYRNGRLSSRPAAATRVPADALVLRYPTFAVLYAASGTGCDEAVLGQLCRVGLKVSFIHPDMRTGTALAQKTGARFYPASMEPCRILADMDVRRTPASLVLVSEGAEVPEGCAVPVLRFTPADVSDHAVSARLLLFALHPDCRRLLLSGGFKGLVRVS